LAINYKRQAISPAPTFLPVLDFGVFSQPDLDNQKLKTYMTRTPCKGKFSFFLDSGAFSFQRFFYISQGIFENIIGEKKWRK
jgi:hypothetical protein